MSSGITTAAKLALSGRALGTVLGLLACNTSGFKDTYMALDSEGNRKRDVFYTDTEEIYCVAEMASGTADVTVTARLRVLRVYDLLTGEPIERTGEIIAAEEQAPGIGTDITASFLIEKPEGAEVYPAGQFICELYLDGQLESSLDFEIRYPACPFMPIEAESSCAGLVLLGSECPSPAGGFCTCTPETGTWTC
jgi:hypothetical protein